MIADKRMQSIIKQLLRIIHIMCKDKGIDAQELFEKYTNITQDEWCVLKKRNKEEKRGITSF